MDTKAEGKFDWSKYDKWTFIIRGSYKYSDFTLAKTAACREPCKLPASQDVLHADMDLIENIWTGGVVVTDGAVEIHPVPLLFSKHTALTVDPYDTYDYIQYLHIEEVAWLEENKEDPKSAIEHFFNIQYLNGIRENWPSVRPDEKAIAQFGATRGALWNHMQDSKNWFLGNFTKYQNSRPLVPVTAVQSHAAPINTNNEKNDSKK